MCGLPIHCTYNDKTTKNPLTPQFSWTASHIFVISNELPHYLFNPVAECWRDTYVHIDCPECAQGTHTLYVHIFNLCKHLFITVSLSNKTRLYLVYSVIFSSMGHQLKHKVIIVWHHISHDFMDTCIVTPQMSSCCISWQTKCNLIKLVAARK